MKILFKLLAGASLAASCNCSIVACAKENAQTASVANNLSQVCSQSFKANVWDQLYEIAESNQTPPSSSDLKVALASSIRQQFSQFSGLHTDAVDQTASGVANLFSDLMQEAQTPTSTDDEEAELNLTQQEKVIRRLARLELGDHSSPSKQALQLQINSTLAAVGHLSQAIDCGSAAASMPATPSVGVTSVSVESSAMIEHWRQTRAPAVYGAWKTMSTAYQSCEAVGLTPLTEQTPPAEGISVLGKKTVSHGDWRVVSNLPKFLKTNPYYERYAKPSSACFAVTSQPLIYDFGGKPAVPSTTEINLFKEKGRGATNSLGVDCSGFVTTANLTAGLKPKSGVPIRSAYATALGSSDFKNPNGSLALDCLIKVGFTPNDYEVHAGDIVAITGHVVMIDEVGGDPFGITHLESASQCTPANVKVSNFDFTIIQSSPYKGGIGIQRSRGADYVAAVSELSSGLRSYAIAACKARFGISSTPSVASATVVRPSTATQCVDSHLNLTNSSCLDTCSAVF